MKATHSIWGRATFLTLTLDNMATQGLWDHLGGGFFRYAVDLAWQLPHFEKMLYDNAQLAILYLHAATVFEGKRKYYQEIVRQTLNFMLAELSISNSGAFAASLSAIDDNNVEGGYYIWRLQDLKDVLTQEELKVASRVWAIEGEPDIEDAHHLVQAADVRMVANELELDVKHVEHVLNKARMKMQKARAKRVLPKDNKVVASWNGLALSAFSLAARIEGGDRYYRAAEALFEFLMTNIWDGNKIYRSSGAEGLIGASALEDYALIAAGVFDWMQISKHEKDIHFLEKIVNEAWKRFYGDDGWKIQENMLLHYGETETLLSDLVLPSSSAILADVSLRLSEMTDNQALRQNALRALNVGHEELKSEPFFYATHIGAIARYQAGNK